MQNTTTQVAVRLPADQVEELRRSALDADRTLTQEIRRAIRFYLASKGQTG